MSPTTQKALVLTKLQGDFAVEDLPVPKPGPGEVLIKVLAAALNPVDWKIQKLGFMVDKFPAVLGNDLAGVVEAVGEGVGDTWKVGDRVLTQAQPAVPSYGSFQQYALALSVTLARIPDNISFDEAATLPATLTTAYVGFFQTKPDGLELSPPTSRKYAGKPFVVLAGAGSVGQIAIQLAKLSGFSPIISTSSPSNFERLKYLGATHVFDRNLSGADLKAEISAILNGQPLKYVFDGASTATTQEIGYSLLDGGDGDDDEAELVIIAAPAVTKIVKGKALRPVRGMLRSPKNQKLLEGLYQTQATGWLESGAIKPHIAEVLPGGLKGIPEGLQRLENDKVSGKKLVAHPHDE